MRVGVLSRQLILVAVLYLDMDPPNSPGRNSKCSANYVIVLTLMVSGSVGYWITMGSVSKYIRLDFIAGIRLIIYPLI